MTVRGNMWRRRLGFNLNPYEPSHPPEPRSTIVSRTALTRYASPSSSPALCDSCIVDIIKGWAKISSPYQLHEIHTFKRLAKARVTVQPVFIYHDADQNSPHCLFSKAGPKNFHSIREILWIDNEIGQSNSIDLPLQTIAVLGR